MVRTIGCNLVLLITLFISYSATDEDQNWQSYIPVDELTLNSNDRLQQIMKGSGSSSSSSGSGSSIIMTSSDSSWAQRTKTENLNIEAEIAKLNTTYVYQNTWPAADIKFGSVSAVSIDKDGYIVVFHRVDRIWSQDTFNNSHHFQETYKGPIRESTVVGLQRDNGNLVYEWGKNIFYMPHGLTVDHENNVWVTDVALHQVFKFAPRGAGNRPLLSLGTAFSPGAGKHKFCKPTSVVVLENGDFFVADGYCNARILKYSKEGEIILSWGQNSFAGASYEYAPPNYFAIPHALTFVPEQELVCTADRENGRIQCFHTGNGTFHSQYHSQIIGDRLFSLAYTPAQGGAFVVVNGPNAGYGVHPEHNTEVRGYVLDIHSKEVISKFGPNGLQFENPHDVAVTTDGMEIYVAELDPKRIHKFLHKSLTKSMPLTAAKPTATTGIETLNAADSLLKENNTTTNDNAKHENSDTTTHKHPGGTAVLVATLMLLFAFLTFAMALLIARRRKRGNDAFNVGQPSELVYRKLVASSSQNVCDEC